MVTLSTAGLVPLSDSSPVLDSLPLSGSSRRLLLIRIAFSMSAGVANSTYVRLGQGRNEAKCGICNKLFVDMHKNLTPQHVRSEL